MWKKLLTFILCFCLVHIQTSQHTPLPKLSIGMEEASAQMSECENVEDDISNFGSGDRDVDSNLIDQQAEENQQTLGDGGPTSGCTGSGNSAQRNAFITQVMGWITMAIGIAGFISGMVWLCQCLGQADVIVFTVASAAAIVAEIVYMIAYFVGAGKASDRLADAVVGASEHTNDAQIASLEAAIDETKKAKKWAIAREVTTYVVAGTYVAALITAIALGVAGKTIAYAGQDICKGRCSSGVDGEPCDNIIDPAADSPPLFANKDYSNQLFTSMAYQNKENLLSQIEMVNNKNYVNYEARYVRETNQYIDGIVEVIEKVGDAFVPKAHGFMNTIGQLGFGIAAMLIITAIVKAAKKAKDPAQDGVSRAVVIGIWIVLSLSAGAMVSHHRSEISKVLDEYEELKKKLEDAGGGSVVDLGTDDDTPTDDGSTGDTGDGGGGNYSDTNVSDNPTDPMKGICVTGDVINDKNVQAGADQCGKKTYSPRASADFSPISGINGAHGGAEALGDAQNMVKSLSAGDGISNDIIKRNGNLNAIRDKEKRALKLLAAGHKQLGDKGVPSVGKFKSMVKAGMYKIRKAAAAAASKLTAAQLAEVSKSSLAAPGDKKKDEAYWKKQKMPSFNQPDMTAFGGIEEEDFDDDQMPMDDGLTDDASEMLNDLDYAQNDIVKDTGLPIWKIISGRYRRSAFPIFFTKVKLPGAKGKKAPAKKEETKK